MAIKIPSSLKLLTVVTLLSAAVILAGIPYFGKLCDKAVDFIESYRRIKYQTDVIFDMVRDIRGLIVTSQDPVPKTGITLVFSGHIYPYNGYYQKPEYQLSDSSIDVLLRYINYLEPDRVIFGGDIVGGGDKDEFEYVDKRVRGVIGSEICRFILGNHDLSLLKGGKGVSREDLEEVYGKPYWYEDIGGVRLVYLNSIINGNEYGIGSDQLEFIESSLDGSGYTRALVFIHHALWAGDTPYVNARYQRADELKEGWLKGIMPFLKKGRVMAVFGGDGGVNKSTYYSDIEGIPHYLTGWSFNRDDRPNDFLRIDVSEEGRGIKVYRYIISEEGVRRLPLYYLPSA